jgi:hypothetical protein
LEALGEAAFENQSSGRVSSEPDNIPNIIDEVR